MSPKDKLPGTDTKALKQAIDKQAKDEADIKYQETLEQARKMRDEIMDEARKALNDARE